MPESKARPNRPTQGDGFEHRLLGPQHLALQRAQLSKEMLQLIAECRQGAELSPAALRALDRAMASVYHLCETLKAKHQTPVEPGICQTMEDVNSV